MPQPSLGICRWLSFVSDDHIPEVVHFQAIYHMPLFWFFASNFSSPSNRDITSRGTVDNMLPFEGRMNWSLFISDKLLWGYRLSPVPCFGCMGERSVFKFSSVTFLWELAEHFWNSNCLSDFRKASLEFAHSGGNRRTMDLLDFPLRFIIPDDTLFSCSFSAASLIPWTTASSSSSVDIYIFRINKITELTSTSSRPEWYVIARLWLLPAWCW